MKKTLVVLTLGVFLLSGCAWFKKDGDTASSADRAAQWENADVTDLSDTKLSQLFKKQINPVIYFEFNSVVLTSTAADTLNTQVEWLKKYPNAMVVIEGHCDERGTREYNLALGDRRAMAVRDYFLIKGIDAKRIRTISYGKERPDVVGASENAWAKNRRAVTIVN